MFLRQIEKAVIRVLAVVSLCLIALPQDLPEPHWTPPPSRKKSWNLFAPKPRPGDNIFKGEAEVWLADAIEKREADSFALVEDKFILDYIAQLGSYLVSHSTAPNRRYQFGVIYYGEKDAMNFGGGRVYVTAEMLREVASEDELASVLAHEIAHDAFGHVPKTVTRQLLWMKGKHRVKTPAEAETALTDLLDDYRRKPFAELAEALAGIGRFDELEADRAAFYNVYQAGYNPRGLADVLKRLERDTKEELGKSYGTYQVLTLLLGSHPPTAQRSFVLGWQSAFVNLPSKESHVESAAFAFMKARLAN